MLVYLVQYTEMNPQEALFLKLEDAKEALRIVVADAHEWPHDEEWEGWTWTQENNVHTFCEEGGWAVGTVTLMVVYSGIVKLEPRKKKEIINHESCTSEGSN